MDLSICIPTFNRCGELALTLESLRSLRIPPGGVELIVVDNNSSDETRSLVESRIAEYPFRLRYVLERRQGANFARNTGLAAAAGPIVAYMDDDVDVAPWWAEAILTSFSETGAAGIGGRTWLVYSQSRPDWLPSDSEVWLSRVDLGLQRKVARAGDLCSCNLAFDRVWFDRVGTFRTDLGRRGSCLLSNDETELMERILQAGGKLYYDPVPIVGHRVAVGRLKRKWFWRRTYWQGRGEVRSRPLRGWKRIQRLCSAVAKGARYLSGMCVRSLRHGPGSPEVEQRIEWFSWSIGEVWECVVGPRMPISSARPAREAGAP